MNSVFRIGITQRVEELQERGERRDCLDQEWARLLEGAGCIGVAIPNRSSDVRSFIGELGLKGVILSGGNDLATMLSSSLRFPGKLTRVRPMRIEIIPCPGRTSMAIPARTKIPPARFLRLTTSNRTTGARQSGFADARSPADDQDGVIVGSKPLQ